MVEEKNTHNEAEVRTFKDVKERFTAAVQRNKGKLTVILIVVGVLLLGGMIKLFEYSSSPGFCVLFCHEMVPEYRTWKESIHGQKGIDCHACHYEPGFLGTLKAKWRAKNQLLSHLFGGFLSNTLEKAEKEKAFLEIQNIHQQGDRRFYIKADEHGVKIVNDNCNRCHPDVTEKEVISEARGVKVAHSIHIKEKNLQCTDCHINIVHGEEAAKRNLPKMRICFRCHNEPGSNKKLSKANCKNCHIAQEAMWAGKSETAKGIKAAASPMYGSVDCSDCHTAENGYKKPKNSDICLNCHDDPKDIENFYIWRDTLKVKREKLVERINVMVEKIAYAKKEFADNPEKKETIRSAEAIFEEAKLFLAVVNKDGSNGIHNNAYALMLVNAAATKLQESDTILPE